MHSQKYKKLPIIDAHFLIEKIITDINAGIPGKDKLNAEMKINESPVQ